MKQLTFIIFMITNIVILFGVCITWAMGEWIVHGIFIALWFVNFYLMTKKY